MVGISDQLKIRWIFRVAGVAIFIRRSLAAKRHSDGLPSVVEIAFDHRKIQRNCRVSGVEFLIGRSFGAKMHLQDEFDQRKIL